MTHHLKLLTLALALIAVAALAACGGSDDDESSPTPTEAGTGGATATATGPATPTVNPSDFPLTGEPGSCGIVEELYCQQAQTITLYSLGRTEMEWMGFNVPVGTRVFAPADGVWLGGVGFAVSTGPASEVPPAPGGYLDGGGCPEAPCPIELPKTDYSLVYEGGANAEEQRYVSGGEELGSVLTEELELGVPYNLLYNVTVTDDATPTVTLDTECSSGADCQWTWEIGETTRAQNDVSLSFSLTVSGPAGCSVPWSSFLAQDPGSRMYLLPSRSGDTPIQNPIPLSDASGVAIAEGSIDCGEHEGALTWEVPFGPANYWLIGLGLGVNIPIVHE